MERLTVLMPVCNEEEVIEDALKSVSWASEILVVDSGSTDKTIEICKKYTDKILYRPYTYYADQVNWGINKASSRWILLLDADERVTPELEKEIKYLLQRPKSMNQYKGYQVARRHYFLGKWLRYGGRYPLYNIRLFQKSCRFEDRLVHPHIILEKKQTGWLKNDIIHLSDRSLEQYFEKFNKYTTYEALEAYKNFQHKQKIPWKEFFTNFLVFKSVIKKFWIRLPVAPILRFFYMYFLRLGFLDGYKGFMVAKLYAWADYVSRMKFKELLKKKNARYKSKI